MSVEPRFTRVFVYDKDGNPIDVSHPLYVSLSGGDIEIGAVEIKNGSSDTRATVSTKGLTNIIHVGLFDDVDVGEEIL